MKGLFRLLSLSLIFVSAAFVSCGDDDSDTGWIAFDKPALFLSSGQTRSVAFSSANIRSYSLSESPAGWPDPVIDYQAKTVQITAPAADDEDAMQSGSLTISGVTLDNKTVKATMYLSTSDQIDLSGKQANSYLLNKANTNYRIDVMHKGDGKTALQTERIALLWQTKKDLIQYLEFEDGKASFYIGTDNKTLNVNEGNALIGAYNADGNLIWSWHIWATDYDSSASTVAFNGYTMMTRNLGALKNSNTSSDEKLQKEDVLASYGLYYQWGRKDPFVGPSAYKGTGNATVYDGAGSLQTGITNQEVDSERGTMKYAIENPLTFITGTKESAFDWLWPGNADYSAAPRWKDEKTLDDPCPYGWRVAPAAAFAGLTIKEPLRGDGVSSSLYADKFGWTMTDGAAESLFIGAGRRIYTNASIQNIYVNSIPDSEKSPSRAEALYDQPWIGLYWTTSGAAENRASAFYFWFDKADLTQSGLEYAKSYERANGMQVRCVKAE